MEDVFLCVLMLVASFDLVAVGILLAAIIGDYF